MTEEITFSSLGLAPEICQRCEKREWKVPTEIQQQAIPPALEGKDIIGISKTGSGKTGAFILPILHHLKTGDKKPISVLVLSPTRELALQTDKWFRSLGSFLKIKCAVVIGGVDIREQKKELKKSFHVLIATPGRLQTLLENPYVLTVSSIKYLVLDEADRLLEHNFKEPLKAIFKLLPQDRQSFFFSASINDEVRKLAALSLKEDVVWLGVEKDCLTVETLKEQMVNVPEPEVWRMGFLYKLLQKLSLSSVIVFCKSRQDSLLLATFLVERGMYALPFSSKLDQATRVSTLNLFKNKKPSILVATNLASRGLDIPLVECIINYSLPLNKTDYCHRVGRTARAGHGGLAITLATNKEFSQLHKLEKEMDKYLEPVQLDQHEVAEEAAVIKHSYARAQMLVAKMKEEEEKKLKRKFTYEDYEKGTAAKKRKH